jgi:hypothetical protein
MGQNLIFYENFLFLISTKLQYFQFELFMTLLYMIPFRNHQKAHGVSLQLGDFGTFPELPRFRYSDRNFLIHLANLHIKSHKLTS